MPKTEILMSIRNGSIGNMTMSKRMVTTWGRTKTRIQVEYKAHCTGITEEANVDKNPKEKKNQNEAGHVSPVLPSPSVVLEDCCCSPSEGAAVGTAGGWD